MKNLSLWQNPQIHTDCKKSQKLKINNIFCAECCKKSNVIYKVFKLLQSISFLEKGLPDVSMLSDHIHEWIGVVSLDLRNGLQGKAPENPLSRMDPR